MAGDFGALNARVIAEGLPDGDPMTIYVDAGGDDARTGLLQDQPVATLARAEALLRALAPVVTTRPWRIRITGDLPAGQVFGRLPSMAGPLLVEGDEAGEGPTNVRSTIGSRMEFSDGGRVDLYRLRLQDGVIMRGGMLSCRRVRVIGGEIGFGGVGMADVRLQSCDLVGTTYAGLWLDQGSRGQVRGCLIQRNAVGVRVEGGSVWTREVGNTWGTGADANTVPFLHLGGGRETGLHGSTSVTETRVYVAPGLPVTVAGPAVTLVAEQFTAPGFWFVAGQRLRVAACGTMTGAAGKAVRLYAGLADGTGTPLELWGASGITWAGPWRLDLEVHARGPGQQLVSAVIHRDGQPATVAVQERTAGTDADWRLALVLATEDPGSSVTLHSCEIHLAG